MTKKKNSLTFTYPGIVEKPSDAEIFILDELMRKFQSAKRYLRERIFEGYNRKEAVNVAKPFFLSNSRYMRDAFLEAEASISSQKELLPTYVKQNEVNIKHLEQQIDRLSTSKRKKNIGKIEYKKSKMRKLFNQKNYFQYHIDHGTVPKMVDGSKRLLKDLKNKKITKEEWRDKRSNAIYARGEKSKGGNENIKLSYVGEDLFDMRILNPLSNKKGDRISFAVRIPEKFVCFIASYLETGNAYSIRVLRTKGRYEIRLTVEEEVSCTPSFDKGIAGLDMNPDNLSVTIVYPNGNFRAYKVFWLHEINTVSADKRDWIIQNTVIEMIEWIKTFHVDALSIEGLTFIQQNKGSSFNRMSHHFSFSSMTKAMISACFKENIALIQVKPYYSSFIGKMKYQQIYGLSIHQSAAFVLARRAMGFEEKIPKDLLSVLFAKEAKKGQPLSDLFKHWKKVKAWHDGLLAKRKRATLHPKDCLIRELLIMDASFNHEIKVPF
jgi:predicted transposase